MWCFSFCDLLLLELKLASISLLFHFIYCVLMKENVFLILGGVLCILWVSCIYQGNLDLMRIHTQTVRNVLEDQGTSQLLFTDFWSVAFHCKDGKLPLWGLKWNGETPLNFLSVSKMKNHGVHNVKTLVIKDSSFLPQWQRYNMVLPNASWIQVTDLNADLIQLLKTSENEMVTYIIASSLDGISRRMGKSI